MFRNGKYTDRVPFLLEWPKETQRTIKNLHNILGGIAYLHCGTVQLSLGYSA